MSEKLQQTASSMRAKMLKRYGTHTHHKHNKLHCTYRLHHKTHPVINTKYQELEQEVNVSTGLVRTSNLRKLRKRLDKSRIH